MAVLKIFSIYDKASQAYMRPMFMPTKGIALRGFMDAVADPQHEMHKHPRDYTLFELGEFDESNASITMLKSPVSVANAHELLAKSDVANAA